jgi:hypothetical protein
MKVWKHLQQPGRWTQKFSARQGRYQCSPTNPHADCWCLSGAIEFCYPDEVEREGIFALLARYLMRHFDVPSYKDDVGHHPIVIRWNDMRGRTQQEVVRVCFELKI